MKQFINIFFLTLLFSTCSERIDHKPMLLGNWQGAEWFIEGKPSGRDASRVTFQFNANDSYEAQFGNEPETGTYKIIGNKLFTTETGKQEIMVRIDKITTDSLFIKMNRGGQAETLIFGRR